VIVVSNTALRQVNSDDLLHRLRAMLDGNEKIVSVAAMSPTFTRGWDQWEWKDGERSIRSFVFNVDPQLLPTLGLQLVSGRNFSPEYPSDKTNSILINETMARTLNLTNPVGNPLPGFKYGDTLPPPLVIGVVKDFHILSLHESIEPALLHMSFPDQYGTFLVRVKGGDLSGAVTEIEKAWEKVASPYRFDYTFLDQDIANQYLAEQRWFSIVTYATLLAAIIASLGLFGLAGLSAIRRMKEVGIRKVLGASLPELLQTLNREFLILVGIANLIAWPLAYLVLNQWLQSFAYRTELSIWVFVLSGIAALILALAVISYHTIRTASINPSEVLRHE
jgi:putative ABC transport system permease protein